MQYNITLNQEIIGVSGSCQAAAVFSFIKDAYQWARRFEIEGEHFYWLTHQKIMDELAKIVGSSKSLQRYLNQLRKNGLLDVTRISRCKTGYRITDKAREILRISAVPEAVPKPSRAPEPVPKSEQTDELDSVSDELDSVLDKLNSVVKEKANTPVTPENTAVPDDSSNVTGHKIDSYPDVRTHDSSDLSANHGTNTSCNLFLLNKNSESFKSRKYKLPFEFDQPCNRKHPTMIFQPDPPDIAAKIWLNDSILMILTQQDRQRLREAFPWVLIDDVISQYQAWLFRADRERTIIGNAQRELLDWLYLNNEKQKNYMAVA